MSTMNTALPAEALRAEAIEEREERKLSWGGVLAGLVVTLGVWMLLTVLGLAIGLSSVDPTNPESAKNAGVMAGIWSAIVPLVALFAGGIVAARAAGIVDRKSGAIHGIVLWGIATIASIAMLGTVIRGVVGTAVSAGAGLTEGAASIAPGGANALGLDANDMMGPINQSLRAEGKPEVTAAQMQLIVRDVAQAGVRQGGVDREMVVRSVTQHTELSRADAQDVANRIEQTWNQKRSQIETGALKAADTTGKAMWWVFFGMVLSLGSSVLGSTLGVRRIDRRFRQGPRERVTPVPMAPPREVYP